MAKTITIIILGIALVIVLLDDMCFIKLLPSDCNDIATTITTTTHCDDTNRYNAPDSTFAGGVTKSVNDATARVIDFRLPTTLTNTGVAISKKAIDMMFDLNEEANTLVCHFVNNVTDPTIIDMVFEVSAEGGNNILVQRDNEPLPGILPSELPTGDGSIFLSTELCPAVCGAIHE